MRKAVWLLAFAVGWTAQTRSGYGQGLLDVLLGKSKQTSGLQIKTPEQQKRLELQKRLKEVKALIAQLRKEEQPLKQAMQKERARLLSWVSKYQKPGSSPKLSALRMKIAQLAAENALLLRRQSSANESLLESMRALAGVLQDHLDNDDKQLEARLRKLYLARRLEQKLFGDLEQLQQQLKASEELLRKVQTSRAALLKEKEKNRQALDRARRALVGAKPQKRRETKPAPRPVVVKPVRRPAARTQKHPTTKPQSAPVAKPPRRSATKPPRRSATKPPSRPATKPPKHRATKLPKRSATKPPKHRATKPPSRLAVKPTGRRVAPTSRPRAATRPSTRPSAAAWQRKKEELQRQEHEESILSLTFQLYRNKARWLRLRLRDEKIDIETEKWRIQLRQQIIGQMKSIQKELISKTRDGLWYFRALRWDLDVLSTSWGHSEKLLSELPGQLWSTVEMRGQIWQQKPAWQRIGLGGVLLLLLGFVWYFFHRLRSSMATRSSSLSERVAAETLTRQMWGLLHLGLRLLEVALPWAVVGAGIFALLWLVGFPASWRATAFTFALLAIGARVLWESARLLFASDPSVRFLSALDDASAQRFRRVFQGLTLVLLSYVPLLYLAHALEYPEAFTQWLEVPFYGFLLIGFLLVFFNKEAILSMIPTGPMLGRVLILFLHRFYPILLLLAFGIYGVFVWGYINLAVYLSRGLVLSALLLGLAYGLYRLSWVFGLWLFGFSKGEEGLLNVEKRWARNLLRLFRAVVGLLLLLLCVAGLLWIWRLGGGMRALTKLFRYPFIQVKDTQITLLSLLKLIVSVGGAIWLAGFLKRKASELLYPALRMTPANQHASNTVLGYTVLILGLLFGLQWMGVGLGVLAVFAGIIGIGVGFGIQNIMSNFISGLIITFGQPIKTGDIIEVEGMMGEVKEITGRSTTIETFDLRIVLIPNSEILTKKVINWSMGQPCVYAPLKVGVAYGSDVQLVLNTLRETADAHPLVLKDPSPSLRFGNFGDNSLEFSLWVAVNNPLRRFEVISDMRIDLDRRFRELGIVISFPQRDIHLSPPLEEALLDKLKAKTSE